MQLRNPNILLESGTNELEIMEFVIAGQLFGINVAKVREIMKASPVRPMQNAHPIIEGIFKPRDVVITVIDLARYLHLPPADDTQRDIFIVTRFNQLDFAFHVHSVEGIIRVSWKSIQKPDPIIYGGDEGVATGIVEHNGRLITILDFEKIVSEINPESGIQLSSLDNLGDRPRSDRPILIAEDSAFLSRMILESLHRSGYTNVIKTNNGQEAWDFILDAKKSGDPLREHVACLITDIEMPQMDGHHLIKLIRNDSALENLPVLIFSSLIDDEMYLKGQQLGADEQISKPEIARLVTLIDKLILKSE